MASTSETSSRPSSSKTAKGSTNGTHSETTEDELLSQIQSLQNDVQSILKTLGKLGNEKVSDAKGHALDEYSQLVEAGQNLTSTAADQVVHFENQIKDTIRQRPLTAVLGALGVGFLIALVSR